MASQRVDAKVVEEIIRLSRDGIPIKTVCRRLKITWNDINIAVDAANRKNDHALVVFNGNVFSGEAAERALIRYDLNERIRRILIFKNDAAASLWRLGHEINDLHKSKVWQLRAETWDSFCRDELKMSSVHANRLADVAVNYTAKQMQAHGVSKLGLLLTAPPEARPALKALVVSGASTREVADAVRVEKRKVGFARPARDGSRRHAPVRKSRSTKIECPYCGMSWTPKRAT